MSDVAALAEGVLAGERKSLARAITLVESTRDDHARDAQALLAVRVRGGQVAQMAVVELARVGLQREPFRACGERLRLLLHGAGV